MLITLTGISGDKIAIHAEEVVRLESHVTRFSKFRCTRVHIKGWVYYQVIESVDDLKREINKALSDAKL
jgi:hypothetical protein